MTGFARLQGDAGAAEARGDHRAALDLARTALGLADGTETELPELAGVLRRAAVEVGELAAALELVEDAAARCAPHLRPALLLMAGTISMQVADFERQRRNVLAAFHLAQRLGDRAHEARALAELAAPWSGGFPVSERLAFGERALAIAENLGDRYVLAQAMGKYAMARVYAGVPDFALSRRAAQITDGDPSPDGELWSHINHVNWTTGSLAFGDYREAATAVRRLRSRSTGAHHAAQARAFAHLLAWRVGEWGSVVADDTAWGAEMAFVRGIRAAIAFERDPSATTDILGPDGRWGERYPQHIEPLLLALAYRARAARREPLPERGVAAVIERVRATDLRTGWDDLLAPAATIDPPFFHRMRAILGDQTPAGPRGGAAALLANAIVNADDEGCVAAAEALDRTGDPLSTARAYAAAASIRVRDGRRAAGHHARAAELFTALGAHRSLAELHRAHPSSSSLAAFPVPEGWRRGRARSLTRREREVADLARQGLTARAIADHLGISHRTVQIHLDAVRRKLGIARKSDIVRAFLSGGPGTAVGPDA